MVQVNFNKEPVDLAGEEKKVGDQAPNFTVVANDLSEVKLSDFDAKVKLVSVVPSLNTGVCSKQTRKFNEEAAQLKGVDILTISMDLPFAQAEWCAANGIEEVTTLSDHRTADFGLKYGVLMEHLRLLARAVFVIDESNTITYVEYVDEVTTHPDYEAALEAAKKAVEK